MKLNISRLDDGSGIKSTFMRNIAVWHKACRVNFDETRLSLVKLHQDKNNSNDNVPRSNYLYRSTMTVKKLQQIPVYFVKRVAICKVYPYFKLIQK